MEECAVAAVKKRRQRGLGHIEPSAQERHRFLTSRSSNVIVSDDQAEHASVRWRACVRCHGTIVMRAFTTGIPELLHRECVHNQILDARGVERTRHSAFLNRKVGLNEEERKQLRSGYHIRLDDVVSATMSTTRLSNNVQRDPGVT